MNTTNTINPNRPFRPTSQTGQVDASALLLHDADANERHAVQVINRSMNLARASSRPISQRGARLIAATIHLGPHTALGRFAATGTLSSPSVASRATDELFDTYGNSTIPRPWWRALGTYLDAYIDREARRGTT